MDKNTQERLITFLDSVQRTIIAERVDEECNEKVLVVKNPVVVNIMPQRDPISGQPTGQMALQLIPLFFREFQGDKSEPIFMDYNKESVTSIRFKSGFDFRLYNQYEQMFNPSNIIIPNNSGRVTPASVNTVPSPGGQKVIKLFED